MARRKAVTDTNSAIAGLLRDLAAVQTSKQSKWGYARAADAIAALATPIESFLRPDGTLRKIARIGPSSTRVILEVLQTGASPTVARARADSDTFLSPAEVLAALKNRRLRGLSPADYRGDLQMHSTYSDGSQTLEVIVDTGIARGYEYAAVTDHSYGLPIAHGVSMARLAAQHRHIDRLNETYAGRFRLIKGIEANILADGSVDMTPAERRRLEIVVAAPHSALRSSADQTRRILKAVRTPGVHILGHPRGRKHGVRPGVTADWDRIFEAASRATVAVEIDGDPRRQDIDYALARWTPAASSRSTATPTRPGNGPSRRRRSRTRAWRKSRTSASSTAGRSTSSWTGPRAVWAESPLINGYNPDTLITPGGTQRDADAPSVLFSLPAGPNRAGTNSPWHAASRDGQRFLVNTLVEGAPPITVLLNWKPRN